MRVLPRLTALLTLALALPLAAVPAYAVNPGSTPDAARTTVGRTVSTPVAARALAAVEDLGKPGSGDATMALRDLRIHRDELSAEDQARASRLLQRPGGDQSQCFDTVCVHWYSSGQDKSTQSYVNKVANIAQHVLQTYADAGYRAPEADGSRGGNGKLDIYLQDLGDQGLYGYCDSDDPPADKGPYDAPAYCSFDNDYSSSQFPAQTPLENLEVTAAHELFHAVQFAYDYYEDRWFMEATAAWAEDELYTDVNDNLQYLVESPLSQPTKSMDHFETYGVRQYGDWIFFRYLTEHWPDAEGGLPTVIRDIWERADGSEGAPDDYSIQAIKHVLAGLGTDLRTVWADFASANRRPGTSYDEGKANHYPRAGLSGRVHLDGHHRTSGWKTRHVDHLAASTIRFVRARKMRASRLKLHLNLPGISRGSAVVATIYQRSGRPHTVRIPLKHDGNKTRKVGFGKNVKWVEVTLANAGTHYHCWRPTDTGYSCLGRPKDDDLPLKVWAKAVR